MENKQALKPLGFKEYFVYGMGNFASQLSWTMVSTYLSIFYTDVFGLMPAAVALLMLIAKVWDGINVSADGKVCGFAFQMRVPYYRGITLSIIRNIQVTVDGIEYPRDALTITVNGETFTLEEARTVISNRWLFGQFGEITVKKDGGLAAGKHHIKTVITVAPSYMPMQLVKTGEADFTI